MKQKHPATLGYVRSLSIKQPRQTFFKIVLMLASLLLTSISYSDNVGRLATQAIGALAKESSARAAPSVPLPPAGSFAPCQQLFPQEEPLDISKVDKKWRATALCSDHFAVLHSALSKTPLVVVERLTREQMSEALDEARTDEFYPDPRLPVGSRSELDDFRGTGMDRGHMAAAGNQPDQTAMAQSFSLSNIVPQDPVHNRKIWSKIESDARKFVRRARGNVYVFTGPLFRGPQKQIGLNRVWVPSHIFKLVYDEAGGRAWAYVLENNAQARIEAPMDYPAFVAQTGWQVLPQGALR